MHSSRAVLGWAPGDDQDGKSRDLKNPGGGGCGGGDLGDGW